MEKRAINPSALSTPPGYSQIVQVSGGTTVYISGQVPLDTSGTVVGAGSLERQARQVFANLKAALAEVGATLDDLVRIGIYVVGHDDEKLDLIRRVRDEELPANPPPASTLLGVERLAISEFLIEVDGIAVIEGP
jgi:enamine deaminase RidA (YjgF/YER057c/UK114 family)